GERWRLLRWVFSHRGGRGRSLVFEPAPERLQLVAQLLRGGVTLFSVLCKRLRDDAFEFRRGLWQATGDRRGLAFQNRHEDVGDSSGLEGAPPGEHFVKHHAKA